MRELYIHKQSAVHCLDSRVKLILTLVFILLTSLLPNNSWAAYILSFSLVLSIAILAGLGIGTLIKRSLLALIFILAAVPLIFTGPPPLLSVPVAGNFHLTISPAGSLRVINIAIKSWLSIQAAVLLVAATPFQNIVTAMKQLKVPAVFTAVIGLMWRYLRVITEEAGCLMRARSSRSAVNDGMIKAARTIFWQAHVTGRMAGSLFLRSVERSDRVYAAMLSRGYNGDLLAGEQKSFSPQSWKILCGGVGIAVVIYFIGWLAGG